MMSGVRASSIRMESTSSTMAKTYPALDLLLAGRRHAVVAQVVEAQLAVDAVGDVARVLGAAHFGDWSCWMYPQVSPRKR